MATANPVRETKSATQAALETFILEGIQIPSAKSAAGKAGSPVKTYPSRPVWKGLRDVGTELWLDTGDLDGAEKLWCAEFSALTTNNTLLNNEVKKGIYDDVIRRAAGVLGKKTDPQAAVVEIGFILNARHGLRLVEKFGAKVSVELHTDLADKVEETLQYARRIYSLCPEFFIVKIPLTPAGLITTRQLRAEKIPINMTLEFSARQNYLAARFSNPSYVNVFLGRINAYFSDNQLGSGNWAGETATIASQLGIDQVNRDLRSRPPVRQIAASLRSGDQAPSLAGVDVFTMPLKVAEGVLAKPPASWKNQKQSIYQPEIDLRGAAKDAGSQLLWEIDADFKKAARALDENPPRTPEELVERLRDAGIRNLFPQYSKEELATIARDGKIPKHAAWKEKIAKGDAAIDALLNAAGLASFSVDQKELDDRVRGLIGR